MIVTSGPVNAFGPSSKYRTTVSLDFKVEKDGVALILSDDQIGVYQHFILEKSLDGKTFIEVARADEISGIEGSRQITFKDFPFEKSSISCVFYRIRAVDQLGWFDFTNTVSIINKLDIARNPGSKNGLSQNNPLQQF